MTTPTISHLLTRRYVTELVRSPRAASALGGRRRPAQPAAIHPAPRPSVAE
jgi:hypothetical protein